MVVYRAIKTCLIADEKSASTRRFFFEKEDGLALARETRRGRYRAAAISVLLFDFFF